MHAPDNLSNMEMSDMSEIRGASQDLTESSEPTAGPSGVETHADREELTRPTRPVSNKKTQTNPDKLHASIAAIEKYEKKHINNPKT